MNIDISGVEEMLGALFNAALNGLIEGLFPAALAWVFVRCSRRSNAATRHAALFSTLLLLALLPALEIGRRIPWNRWIPSTLISAHIEPFRSTRNVESSQTRVVGAPEPEPLSAESSAAVNTGNREEETPAWDSSGAPEISGAGGAGTVAEFTEPDGGANSGEQEGNALAGGPSAVRGISPEAVGWKWRALPELTFEVPSRIAAALMALWLVLGAVRLSSLFWQCMRLRAIKHSAAQSGSDLAEKFQRAARDLAFERAPKLLLSDRVQAPMAAGYLRPAVLLPRWMEGGEHLEAVLRHELAHIARGDHWANLIQQSIRAACFFHPLVAWLSRRITIEREIACDDFVLSGRLNRRDYALLLTEFAGRSRELSSGRWTAAPAAWSSSSQLKERINMILDTQRNAAPRMARGRAGLFAAAATMAALFAVAAGPRVVLAGDEPSAKNEAEQKNVTVAVQPTIANGEGTADVVIRSSSGAGAVAVVSPDRGKTLVAAAAPEVEDDDESAPKKKPRRAPGGLSLPGPTPPPMVEPPAIGAPGQPPVAGGRAHAGHPDDLERRLDRLEKLVQSLVQQRAERDVITREFRYETKPGPEIKPFFFDGKEMNGFRQFSEESNKALRERLFAELGRRDAERQRELDRALSRMKERGLDGAEGLEAQREALEAARSSLEREMKNIEKQLQRLEKQQQKLEEQRAELDAKKERGEREEKKKSKDASRSENRRPDNAENAR